MAPKIIAHRGYSKVFSENTMDAFQAAAKFPIDGIELDVQLTKDSEVVIIHDQKIDRTSDGHGNVGAMTFDELKTYNFANHQGKVSRIPSLNEFLQWFQETDLFVNIELKTSIDSHMILVEKVYDEIQRFSLEDQVIISSFHHQSVLDFKKQALQVSCGLLYEGAIDQPGLFIKNQGLDAYHIDYKSLDHEEIKECLRQGVDVNVYTVNEVSLMKALEKAKVTSIITDDVLLACQTYGRI